MRARRALVAAAALLGAFAFGTALWLRDGGTEEELPILRGRLLATSTSVDPQAHLFGDRVRARLDVVFDAARVRPESVEVRPSFRPYRVVGRSETRDSFGHVTRVRYQFVLECLTRACLPREDRHVQFPRTGIEYAPRALPDKLLASVDWPPLRVAPRIGSDDLEGLELQADVRDLPALSYRVPPRGVAVAGYALAALVGLVAVLILLRTLAVRGLVSRALARRRARGSALQRALALVRRSTERGELEGSRRALERLAAELRETRKPDLARDASRLAWRRAEPSGTSVDPLSTEVERVIAEETR